MSMFSPDQIISEIEKAPELFQAEVAARYKGLVVDCVLAIGQRLPNNDGTATVHFMLPDPKQFLRFVAVRVNPAEVPSVKFDRDGTLYRVTGPILEASRWSITLASAKVVREEGALIQTNPAVAGPETPPKPRTGLREWNRKNHPWFFSGLGVFILASIFAGIHWLYTRFQDGSTASPPVTPTAQTAPDAVSPRVSPSPSPKMLELSLEGYSDKLESFGRRLALQSDYSDQVRGARVVWQGVVVKTRLGDPNFCLVLMQSAKDSQKYGTTFVEFINPLPNLRDRLRTLEKGDVIEVKAILYDGSSTDKILQADDFSLVPANSASSP